jgi:hypothetical protein
VTVNVYDNPDVKPVTVIGLELPDAVMLPGDEVTVYDVIGEPPLYGAVNDTDILVLDNAVADTPVGALGLVAIIPEFSVSIPDTDTIEASLDMINYMLLKNLKLNMYHYCLS